MIRSNVTNDFIISTVDWAHSEPDLVNIRRKVFMEEQGVSEEEELDGKDQQCLHILAVEKSTNEAVACARITEQGKIGRVAVLKPFRSLGLGKQLMDFCTQQVLSKQQKPYLDAQTSVIPFYEVLGYVCEGDVFLDANIPHRRMNFGLSSFFQTDHQHPKKQSSSYQESLNTIPPVENNRQVNTLEHSIELLHEFTRDCIGRVYFLCSHASLPYLCDKEYLDVLKQSIFNHSDTQFHFVWSGYDPSLSLTKPFIELSRRLPSKIHLRCLKSNHKEFEQLKAIYARNRLQFETESNHGLASIRKLSPVQRELEQDEINRIWENHAFEHPDFRQLNL